MKHRIDGEGNFQVFTEGNFHWDSIVLHLDGEDLDMHIMGGQNSVYLNAEMVEKMYQFIKEVKGCSIT
ncbi:MAG: hypothetical protein GY928_28985 [Colwellia sp.]|nr:hypothetical protein [Colwellia sp.]